MCGIVGLYLKDPSLEPALGKQFLPMLIGMSNRGPDSAGFAIYRNPVKRGSVKLTLQHPGEEYDWDNLEHEISKELNVVVKTEVHFSHAVIVVNAPLEKVHKLIRQKHSELRVVGMGESIELFKEKGLPSDVADNFQLEEFSGSHAIGHTRMATESAITTEHSHPFSTGLDLCLVQNGSLSNHNRLRRWLQDHRGIEFQTDNDTEVAAGYLSYRMSEGATLTEALEAALRDLDGFFTFTVGTKDGFAVVRDGIACKPAVLAETDDWVAMASEFRSIAHLPGADTATIWEPAPAIIYNWSRA